MEGFPVEPTREEKAIFPSGVTDVWAVQSIVKRQFKRFGLWWPFNNVEDLEPGHAPVTIGVKLRGGREHTDTTNEMRFLDLLSKRNVLCLRADGFRSRRENCKCAEESSNSTGHFWLPQGPNRQGNIQFVIQFTGNELEIVAVSNTGILRP